MRKFCSALLCIMLAVMLCGCPNPQAKDHWLKTGETLTFYRVNEEGLPKK